MNAALDRALDEIDAAVMNGDAFDAECNTDDHAELVRLIARWLRALDKPLAASHVDGDFEELIKDKTQ